MLLVLRGLSVSVRASNRAEILEAIRAVENPHNTSRPGKYGELGPYQFRASTWKMHTKVAFRNALNQEIAEEVAIRHYEWIKRGLIRNGFEPSSYNIALAWNNGLSAVVRGRTSAAARDYAERVSNLVQDSQRARLAIAR